MAEVADHGFHTAVDIRDAAAAGEEQTAHVRDLAEQVDRGFLAGLDFGDAAAAAELHAGPQKSVDAAVVAAAEVYMGCHSSAAEEEEVYHHQNSVVAAAEVLADHQNFVAAVAAAVDVETGLAAGILVAKGTAVGKVGVVIGLGGYFAAVDLLDLGKERVVQHDESHWHVLDHAPRLYRLYRLENPYSEMHSNPQVPKWLPYG